MSNNLYNESSIKSLMKWKRQKRNLLFFSNALSLAMLEELKKQLIKCSHDNTVRAIILSAQPPVFSAGHDLNELVNNVVW